MFSHLLNRLILVCTWTLAIGLSCSAQGDLGDLKKNFYLRPYWEKPFDCDSLPADGITTVEDRICANLRLQWADSTLGTLCEMVRTEIQRFQDDTLLARFDGLQAEWRAYRDRHCMTLHGGYVTSTGAVIYMDEMRRLTEIRIVEMEELLGVYRGE